MQKIEVKFLSLAERRLSILVFSLFSAWFLAVLFQGQVLYSLARSYDFDPQTIILLAVAAQVVGLSCGGFIVRNLVDARRLIQLSLVTCMLISTVFFFPPSILWGIALVVCAIMAALLIVSWGYFFKECTPSGQRLVTAAEALILSNIFMIVMNFIGINISAQFGLALCIVMLGGALFLSFRLPSQEGTVIERTGKVSIGKPLAFLCLFITVITINSGLMYQVLNPAFAHHQWLVSWYWAVPYIIALYIMKKLPLKTNRTYVLYVAIAMIGFSFISFMTLDRSVPSYLLVNTIMLGACGVYDLFWWSILGDMLDLTNNPAQVLGIGLSANVLGVLLGGIAGNIITASGIPSYNTSVMALVVIFVILIILPPLHKFLSLLLKNHAFLSTISEMSPTEQNKAADIIKLSGQLTEREGEIALLLLKGRTYKAVASELYLSENTVKTHVKNIYSKLNIRSRMELVNFMLDKDCPLPK